MGDEVVVDGLQGRGVIMKRNGRNLTVRYRDNTEVTRDQSAVHPIAGRMVD